MIARPDPVLANVAEALGDDEIHVWRVDYRASQGRRPLRVLLAGYLGIAAGQVVLIDGEHGRPALAAVHDQSLGFNWSHSGDQALIAVGRNITPGIDLERVRPRHRALEIAARFFSADEAAALAALPLAEQAVAFLEVWTAKEAVVKALGRGIAFGLDRFSVARDAGHLRLLRLHGDDAGAWQLRQLELDADVVGALAWRGAQRQIRVGRLASSA
ncbi:4'-phosphopantetheinyl transferase family protein [Rhodanobacter ginsengiterrae]|uniref:4'-phosphopantetheinyl transferase family protein n=1 Tax=Rhodanobacter ginsengiterrae TaxID=2008451 RepID=UPI003CEDDDB0